MKRFLLLFALTFVVALPISSWQSEAQQSRNPVSSKFRKAKRGIPNEYIVMLKNEIPSDQVDGFAKGLARAHGGEVLGVLPNLIKAFLVRLPEPAARALAKNSQVLFVEENAQSEPVEEPEGDVYYDVYGGSEELTPEGTQPAAPWDLDRIDQRPNPFLDGAYRYNRTGQGVDAYVVDTGINLTHNEFGGRAFPGWDWDPNHPAGMDCHGHGTHVAGLVGGRTYGSAKNVRLYAVRIADCYGGSNAWTALNGVYWAIQHHDSQVPHRPAVMNISYAFDYSDYYATSLDYYVNLAIDHGITVVIAAGNFNWFTGTTSPQGSGSAVINVAATDINDARASFSNFGAIDLFAPGVNVPSAGISSNFQVVNMSGTSMSSPLTAGVAAMYLEAFPTAAPATVSAALTNNATPNEVQNPDPYGGAYTPNLLLYSFFIPPPPHIIFFNSATYSVNESGSFATITVNRSGNDLPPVTVDYSTSDGSATQRNDYTLALGTLSFGAGETSKTFSVLITDDGYVENDENLNLILSNPTGGASLGVPNRAVLTISSNDSSTSQPIDGAQFYVKQQYRDFLNRDPDQSGWDFWTNQITSCGSDAQCIEVRRINVSAAFFLSIEFQGTGFLAYRFYNAALNRPNGLPRYLELLRDTQAVGRGVVVGASGWEAQLEANKTAYANEFVSRSEFTALYPTSLTPTQFVDNLYGHAGITPSAQERQDAINEFNNPTGARGRVLRRVAENQTLIQRETNRAFVLMEYFGYLRRNPDDPPDNNMSGYDFWLDKLNQYNGNYIDAELVKAFITSGEYRQRFGP